MFDATECSRYEGGLQMKWNWRDEGFRSEPRLIRTSGALRLFRAWGGPSQKSGQPRKPWRLLLDTEARHASRAERLFSAWEWGNSCLWITEFRIMAGMELYVGPVDQGDFVDP